MKRQDSRPDIEPASTAAMGDRIRPGTGRRVQILAGVAALTLLIGFVATNASRSRSSEALAAATGARAALAPAVVVATVEPAPSEIGRAHV